MKEITMTLLTLLTSFSVAAGQKKGVQHDPALTPTEKARQFIEGHEKIETYNYCVPGTLTCRQLQIFRSHLTLERVPSFVDIFQSAGRAVGSTGYFLLNGDGSFGISLDEAHDGQIDITLVVEENSNLQVTFDAEGFPTIKDMNIKRLGTTRFVLADMVYSSTQAKIVGYEYDSADPSFKNPVAVYYPRIF